MGVQKDFDREFWEERYHAHATHAGIGGRQPNPQLVTETADLAPGTALDAGCGEGGDAIWLASRGWRVTAVDLAATALRRGREHAKALGDGVASRIDWLEADLTVWTPPEAAFDLVSTHYVHPAGDVEALFRRLAAAVAPGGTLLVVGHHPSDLCSGGPHAPMPGSYITAEQVAAILDPDSWDIAVAEARSRSATDPHGEHITMHDAVLRARRLDGRVRHT